MTISIALATYNGAQYLQEQLDSFVKQTRQPDELVVCDDNSKDNTVEILKTFSKNAPFHVHIYQNETRLGYIKNFDHALSLCSGDIVFLSDQDDAWFPNKLEEIEEVLSRSPEAMLIINDQIITDINLTPTNYTILGNIQALGLEQSWHSAGGCMAIRRPFLNILLPIPSSAHGHDGWISTLANALSVCHIYKKPLQLYRRHEVNTSQSIASRPIKMSPWDMLHRYELRNVTKGWERQINLNKKYCQRLEEAATTLNALGLDIARKNAIADLTVKIDALKQRINLVSIPRLRRTPSLIRFWSTGGYSQFMGWKSAIKDLLRK